MIISKEINESLTLKFSELARKMNEKGSEIISLGLGEPHFETPKSIYEATFEALKNGYTKYSNPQGIYELRKLISEKFFTQNNIDTNPENIIITSGSKQACALIMMSLLEPYDEVINFCPCYVSYIPQIKISEPNAKIVNIDFLKTNNSPDWNLVSKSLSNKTKLIIINTPNNPTGYMFNQSDINELSKLMLKFPNCYLISDEIYENLNFNKFNHISPGSIKSISNRVFTINGFSKGYSMTGWRIGYMNVPNDFIYNIKKIHQHLNTNTPVFIQKGAAAAFKLNENYLDDYNKELKLKIEILKKMVEESSNLSLVLPSGGLFAFLNVSKTGLDSDAFSLNFLKMKSVATTPGIAFGENWDDHVRISLATKLEDYKIGIERLKLFVKEIQQ